MRLAGGFLVGRPVQYPGCSCPPARLPAAPARRALGLGLLRSRRRAMASRFCLWVSVAQAGIAGRLRPAPAVFGLPLQLLANVSMRARLSRASERRDRFPGGAFVARHAGGFFQVGAQFFRRASMMREIMPCSDHRIALGADASAQKQIGDVTPAHLLLVDPVADSPWRVSTRLMEISAIVLTAAGAARHCRTPVRPRRG